MEEKRCVLDEDQVCRECGDCESCDINPNKRCDNCMACIRSGADYNVIEVEEVFESPAEPAD